MRQLLGAEDCDNQVGTISTLCIIHQVITRVAHSSKYVQWNTSGGKGDKSVSKLQLLPVYACECVNAARIPM